MSEAGDFEEWVDVEDFSEFYVEDDDAESFQFVMSTPFDTYLTRYTDSRGIPVPHYTNGSKVVEEATELQAAIQNADLQNIKEEVADVIITALVAARQFGFTAEEALDLKINKDKGRGPGKVFS